MAGFMTIAAASAIAVNHISQSKNEDIPEAAAPSAAKEMSGVLHSSANATSLLNSPSYKRASTTATPDGNVMDHRQSSSNDVSSVNLDGAGTDDCSDGRLHKMPSDILRLMKIEHLKDEFIYDEIADKDCDQSTDVSPDNLHSPSTKVNDSNSYHCMLCDNIHLSLSSITLHLTETHHVQEEKLSQFYTMAREMRSESFSNERASPVEINTVNPREVDTERIRKELRVHLVDLTTDNSLEIEKRIFQKLSPVIKKNGVLNDYELIKINSGLSDDKKRLRSSVSSELPIYSVRSAALSSMEEKDADSNHLPKSSEIVTNSSCELCQISLPDLPAHKFKYHSKGMRCKTCCIVYYSERSIELHRKARHKKLKDFSYEIVDTSFLPCSETVIRNIMRIIKDSGGKSSVTVSVQKTMRAGVSNPKNFCSLCRISLPDLSEHQKKYHTQGFQCDSCSSFVYSKVGMQSHMLRFSACQDASFQTVDTSGIPCGKDLLRRFYINLEKSDGKSSFPLKIFKDDTINSNPDGFCSVCQISIPDLADHEKQFHTQGYQCMECNEVVYTSGAMEEHMDKVRKCNDAAFKDVDTTLISCSKTARRQICMKKSHRNKSAVKCGTSQNDTDLNSGNFCIVCDLSLPDLPEHNSKYHTKGYECEQCNAILFTDGGMKYHQTRIHGSHKVTFKSVDTSRIPCGKHTLHLIKHYLKKSDGKSSTPLKSDPSKVDELDANSENVCNVCRISLPDLPEHQKKYHTNGFQCKQCNSFVYSSNGMKTHRALIYACREATFTSVDTTSVPCSKTAFRTIKQCLIKSAGRSSVFAKGKQARDNVLDANPENVCMVCQISLPDLPEHQIKYHGKGNQCQDCKVIVLTEGGMKNHQTRVHGSHTVSFISVDLSQLPCGKGALHTIQTCLQKTGGKSSISFKMGQLKDDSNSKSDNFCRVCKISLPDLDEHNFVHHTEGKQCEECNVVLFTDGGMKVHQKRVHGLQTVTFRNVDTSLLPCGRHALRQIQICLERSGGRSSIGHAVPDRSSANFCSVCRISVPDLSEHQTKYHTEGLLCERCKTIVYTTTAKKHHKTREHKDVKNLPFKIVDTSLVPCSKTVKKHIADNIKKLGGATSMSSNCNKANDAASTSIPDQANYCNVCCISVLNLSEHQTKYHTNGMLCETCKVIVYTAVGKKLHRRRVHKGKTNVPFKTIDTSTVPCSKTALKTIWNDVKKWGSFSFLCSTVNDSASDAIALNSSIPNDFGQSPVQNLTVDMDVVSNSPVISSINSLVEPQTNTLADKASEIHDSASDLNTNDYCTVCKSSVTDLTAHQNECHTWGHKCEKCNHVVYTDEGMNLHVKEKHRRKRVTFQLINTSLLSCDQSATSLITSTPQRCTSASACPETDIASIEKFSAAFHFKNEKSSDLIKTVGITAAEEFKLGDAINDIDANNNDNFCDVCSCSVKESLILHKKYFHSQAYKCKICRKRVYSIGARTSHAVKLHNSQSDKLSVNRLFEIEDASKLPYPKYFKNVPTKKRHASKPVASHKTSEDYNFDDKNKLNLTANYDTPPSDPLSFMNTAKWCNVCKSKVNNVSSHFSYAHSSGFICALCPAPMLYSPKKAKNHALTHDCAPTDWQQTMKIVDTSNVPMSHISPKAGWYPNKSALESLSNQPVMPLFDSNSQLLETHFEKPVSNFCIVCKYEVDDLASHVYHAHSFGLKCNLCPNEVFLRGRNISVHFYERHLMKSSPYKDTNWPSALDGDAENLRPDMLNCFTRVDLTDVPVAAADCPRKCQLCEEYTEQLSQHCQDVHEQLLMCTLCNTTMQDANTHLADWHRISEPFWKYTKLVPMVKSNEAAKNFKRKFIDVNLEFSPYKKIKSEVL